MSYPHFATECAEHHSLVRDFHPSNGTGERPTIVCLCGSTRLSGAFRDAMLKETLAGHIVLTVGCMTHSDAELGAIITEDVKTALDDLHKRKIDLCDEILVLNVGGYIGDSTRSEVAYAKDHGKPVRWLEPESHNDHPSPFPVGVEA